VPRRAEGMTASVLPVDYQRIMREGELDSTHASAKDCGNRASWRLVCFAPPNYREAPLSCADSRAIPRSGTLFDQTNPRDG
jgi:hypothetical protein